MDSDGSTTACTDLADAHLERVPDTCMSITQAGRFALPLQMVRPGGILVRRFSLVLTAEQASALGDEISDLLADPTTSDGGAIVNEPAG